ncbi:hypothetical protein AKN93_04720 [Thiopseudomonas alkaliphila]|uniref:ABC transporter permease n=1 Tax=Thiopseudomonas alkaliphila TaxID=1697053 RepID=UPI00069FE771|nr:ABC transporter permease [Thiopseudomonas alkaliphila]AKX46986.1 hypothetical protein AKN94_06160 [Thiopseudomonas alkaliphila]AKX48781.1 hypothetical protein AKN93_04720 [Thiopseudomonas alkaliphila]
MNLAAPARGLFPSLLDELQRIARSPYQLIVVLLLPCIMLIMVSHLLSAGVVQHTPIAIVDADHSSLSRRIISNIKANPKIQLAAMPEDMQQALALVRQNKIYAIVEIPSQASSATVYPDLRSIVIHYNAQLRTIGSQASSALSQAIEVALKQEGRVRRGMGGLENIELSLPQVQVTTVGNAQQSFERFLTPLVLPAILNLLLSCAIVATIARHLKAPARPNLLNLIGQLLPYVLIFSAWHLVFWLWMVAGRGWPINGSAGLLVLGIIWLCMATAAIGAALVAITRDIHSAFSLSTIYASGAVTYSDGTLPVLNASGWAQFWANIQPYTHYYRLQIEQVSLASDAAVSGLHLVVLSLYIVGGLLIAKGLAKANKKELKLSPMPDLAFSGGREAFFSTLSSVVKTKPIFSTIALAVVLYSFYYPAAYKSQVSIKLPIAVVDLDDSSLSRSLIRNLQATRSINITERPASPQQALTLLRNRQVDGVIILDHNFMRKALHGHGGLGIYLTAAYLVRAAEVGNAVSSSLEAAMATPSTRLERTQFSRPEVNIEQWPMFDTTEGYGSFVVPAIATLIVQQTLLFGSAMLIGFRREHQIRGLQLSEFLGTWFALSLIGCFTSLLMFGYTFWLQDYPRGGNLSTLLIFIPPFAAATAALGMLLGSVIDRMSRVMQIYAGISILLFLVTGASFPQYMIPDWIIWSLMPFPSTTMVVGFTQINSAGASLSEMAPAFNTLLALVLILGSLAAWRFTWLKRHAQYS